MSFIISELKFVVAAPYVNAAEACSNISVTKEGRFVGTSGIYESAKQF